MLEAHDACGVTHALVSDSFYMESAAAALPAADRDAVRWRNASRLFGLEPARVGA